LKLWARAKYSSFCCIYSLQFQIDPWAIVVLKILCLVLLVQLLMLIIFQGFKNCAAVKFQYIFYHHPHHHHHHPFSLVRVKKYRKSIRSEKSVIHTKIVTRTHPYIFESYPFTVEYCEVCWIKIGICVSIGWRMHGAIPSCTSGFFTTLLYHVEKQANILHLVLLYSILWIHKKIFPITHSNTYYQADWLGSDLTIFFCHDQ